MNELNEEIKLTINTMQCDIDDGAYSELQSHLCSLLEIKRNELQQRLVERTWTEPVMYGQSPYKSAKLDMQIVGEAMLPLTAEELKAGGWRCSDISEACRLTFYEKGIGARSIGWSTDAGYKYCYLSGSIIVRSSMQPGESSLKQIHRIGNEFYWGE